MLNDVKTPRALTLLSALLCVAWLGCKSPVDRPDSKVPGSCEAEGPAILPQKTDILFVIDNSGSMAQEQEAVARELPAFLQALKQGGGVSQDFHVGVITTAVYLNPEPTTGLAYREYPDHAGRLQPIPAEPGSGNNGAQFVDGRFVGFPPGAERILRGDDPEVVSKLTLLVQQGVRGSGQETPFEAARLAVSEPLVSTPLEQGGNAGFLRDGAKLLIVVVADEDDCSEQERPPEVTVGPDQSIDYCNDQGAKLTPVGEYASFFKNLRDATGALREVVWATIGPVHLADKSAVAIQDSLPDGGTILRNAGCGTSFGPGLRQREMAERFDVTLDNLDSICRASYYDTLLRIAAIATASQSVELDNVPDPRLLQAVITRVDDSVQTCTFASGDLRYEEGSGDRKGRVFFEASCPRRADDKNLELRLICIG